MARNAQFSYECLSLPRAPLKDNQEKEIVECALGKVPGIVRSSQWIEGLIG